MGARGKREAFSKRLWKTPLHVCTCSQPFPKRLSRPEFPAFSTIAAASIGHALQHKSDPPKRQENHNKTTMLSCQDECSIHRRSKSHFAISSSTNEGIMDFSQWAAIVSVLRRRLGARSETAAQVHASSQNVPLANADPPDNGRAYATHGATNRKFASFNASERPRTFQRQSTG